jgi:NlpC/P60 family
VAIFIPNQPVDPAGSGAAAVSAAQAWLGTPYCWGGGHGGPVAVGSACVDCSGLVDQVFGITGTTFTQINMGAAVASLNDAGPGDLIFFGPLAPGEPHHVGIYVGAGQMIDAPHTGTVVRQESIAGFGPIYGIRRLVSTTATGTATATTATGTATLTAAGIDETGGAGTGLSVWDILLSPGGMGEAGTRLGEVVAGGLLLAFGLVLVALAVLGKAEPAATRSSTARGARALRRGYRASAPRPRPRAETKAAAVEHSRRRRTQILANAQPFTDADSPPIILPGTGSRTADRAARGGGLRAMP